MKGQNYSFYCKGNILCHFLQHGDVKKSFLFTGVCDGKAEKTLPPFAKRLRGGVVRVTEFLPNGTVLHADIASNACRGESMEQTLAVTTIVCSNNFSLKFTVNTVNNESVGTVLQVTWLNSTMSFIITLKGMCKIAMLF